MVVTKGNGREVGFQDGGYFSRLLKRKKINNHALLAIVNFTLNLTPNLTLTPALTLNYSELRVEILNRL